MGSAFCVLSKDDWNEHSKTIVRWLVPAEGMAKRSGRWTRNPDVSSSSPMPTINWSYS